MGMTVHGIENVSRRFRGIRDRSANLIPVWGEVGDIVAEAMLAQFASSGASGGSPWAPLDPEYLAWKISRGLSPNILVATGEVLAKLTSRPMSIETYRPKSAEFGISDSKYKYHHYGTENMAQRRALFWHGTMGSDASRAVRRYISKGRRS